MGDNELAKEAMAAYLAQCKPALSMLQHVRLATTLKMTELLDDERQTKDDVIEFLRAQLAAMWIAGYEAAARKYKQMEAKV